MRMALWIFFLFSSQSIAFEDPTKGKPFIPWLWEDQFKPTIHNSYETPGLLILAGGAASTVVAHHYDNDVYEHNKKGKNLLMDAETVNNMATVGSGALGVTIAALQIYFDQENGLMHARAISLTALSHVTMAFAIQRERPGGRGDYLPFKSAFPSGHASSAFATAGSLGYAYGWKVGIPAHLLATAISLARVSENTHWISDIAAGIPLGIYWARASYKTKLEEEKQEASFHWVPIPMHAGVAVGFLKHF